MSYTFLQEQGEESSVESFSDIPAYVLSNLIPSAEKAFCNGNETTSFQDFQFGMTSAHSTVIHGEEKWMSLLEDSRAKISALEMREESDSKVNGADCGKSKSELFAKWDHVLCSWKTHPCLPGEEFIEFSGIWPDWGMMRNGECFHTLPLEVRLSDDAYGLLPTPTVTDGTIHGALISKSSTLKLDKNGIPRRYLHDGRSASLGLGRLYLLLTGELLPPKESENLMDWPIGWSGLEPLEMGKFQSWLRQHGEFLMDDPMF